jgi:hypothetical protein
VRLPMWGKIITFLFWLPNMPKQIPYRLDTASRISRGSCVPTAAECTGMCASIIPPFSTAHRNHLESPSCLLPRSSAFLDGFGIFPYMCCAEFYSHSK